MYYFMDVKNSDVSDYELFIKYRSKNIGIWIFLLISLITAMISILSTTKLDASRTSTVFIAILIIMLAVYVYGILGVFSAALSSFLFCIHVGDYSEYLREYIAGYYYLDCI